MLCPSAFHIEREPPFGDFSAKHRVAHFQLIKFWRQLALRDEFDEKLHAAS